MKKNIVIVVLLVALAFKYASAQRDARALPALPANAPAIVVVVQNFDTTPPTEMGLAADGSMRWRFKQ